MHGGYAAGGADGLKTTKNSTTMRKLWIAAVLTLVAAACTVNTPKSFERVVEGVEQNAASYTPEDWKRADERFEDFAEKYDYECLMALSEEEQKEVGRLIARYYKVRMEYASRQAKDYLRTGGNIMEGYMDEMGGVEGAESQLEMLMGDYQDIFDQYEDIFDVDD